MHSKCLGIDSGLAHGIKIVQFDRKSSPLDPALRHRSAAVQILELCLVLVNRRRYTKKVRRRTAKPACAQLRDALGDRAFGVRTPHRNRVAYQKKLSLNPSPVFKRVMNCQRLPNWNGKRCGVNPQKHDELRYYG